MEQNRLDKVAELIAKRRNGASKKLAQAFKGQTKFGQEIFTDEEKISHAMKLTPMDYVELEQEFGAETVYGFLKEVNQLRGKIYGNATA